ncbi:hypothetical protein BCR34DRAFT_590985 [Clohesyomyces aquaticus]|uniref:Uncharacterized protein n=1 Tax=Clohesyomyces aquaticus TaxID=1231657 RepID=A0A1Y1Z4J1_9PLEO|nr:hypothetical protein BCR34DRAFT_590985 [Clohesyomyces aquaticus]
MARSVSFLSILGRMAGSASRQAASRSSVQTARLFVCSIGRAHLKTLDSLGSLVQKGGFRTRRRAGGSVERRRTLFSQPSSRVPKAQRDLQCEPVDSCDDHRGHGHLRIIPIGELWLRCTGVRPPAPGCREFQKCEQSLFRFIRLRHDSPTDDGVPAGLTPRECPAAVTPPSGKRVKQQWEHAVCSLFISNTATLITLGYRRHMMNSEQLPSSSRPGARSTSHGSQGNDSSCLAKGERWRRGGGSPERAWLSVQASTGPFDAPFPPPAASFLLFYCAWPRGSLLPGGHILPCQALLQGMRGDVRAAAFPVPVRSPHVPCPGAPRKNESDHGLVECFAKSGRLALPLDAD